ncbi:hypothetical protein A7985_02865 [Pseudoalteromonas luteoviolacea]|uniref:Uncharacterized protein n=1 Tax=Pseudoalteromonas luteoviolacea TaxID=43657 RepID=A0A1C0TUC0_9GAMM|nr:hypothetical protein [Pseudoalteromonas luteoviolacea]MBQ4812897.1 hypothetical protein [Pseudoalteromonas luteoviolacea]OCQ22916.1 hypothetical protein A7985_02865 [Pseudoalteromonas luteoviolacea]
MAFEYLNVNALLNRFNAHQQHMERYIGFLGTVDFVFESEQVLSKPLSPKHWQSKVLLMAQVDETQNGLYEITETGLWQRVEGELEVGNVTALRKESSKFFKLVALKANKQRWQAFNLI